MRPLDLAPKPFRSVSRYDFPQQFSQIDTLLVELKAMLLSGNYVLGADVTRFETAFAAYCDSHFCKGVNSGTDALIIAMRALGIRPGDEVIAPANTFHATIAAIEWTGATPVLVDALDDSYLLNLEQLSSAVSTRTKAIIPVHLFGKPVKMRRLLAIADRLGIAVIEDAAQAHGAIVDGGRVGSFGAAGCFSFHPSKNLAAAGDAGAIVTQNSDLDRKLEMYRSLGQQAQNDHVVVGLNSKMDALQARILGWKLGQLDEWNRSRAHVAGLYYAGLNDLPVSFQSLDPDEVHVYHLFQMRVQCRDRLLAFLQARGIDAVIRYPTPIHLQPAFRRWGWRAGQFPVSEQLARELLCLPIRPAMAEGDVGFVIDAVRSYFSGHRNESAL